MKIGSTLFEARKVAAPTDSLIRFDFLLGTNTPTFTPYLPALPTPGPPRESREPRLNITASKDQ